MRITQHKSAWIWMAVAVMAVASVARADAATQRAVAHSTVFQFFASHSGGSSVATPAVPRHRAVRDASVVFGAHEGAWTAVLPVLFVGLVTPLNQLTPLPSLLNGRVPVEPAIPISFQRPPPTQIA